MQAIVASALLLASMGQSTGPLAKVKGFLGSKQLEASYRVSVGGREFGTANLKIRRSSDLLFSMKTDEDDYSLLISPKQVREVERGSRHYHEFRPIGRLLIPPSEITPNQGFMIADWILVGDIQSMLPPDTKVASKGKQKLGERELDYTQATYAGPMGSASLDLLTDGDGRPWELRWRSQTPTGSTDYRYTFSQWSNAPKFTDATFRLELPTGFVPAYVRDPADPTTVDAKFPPTSWSFGSGQADPLKLAGGQPFLLILGAEKCEITPRAKGMFVAMARDAAAAKAKVFYGTLRATASSALLVPGVPHLRDANGSAARTLRIEATPMVFLVDKDGVLRRAWLGHDAKREQVVLKELAQGLASLNKPSR